MPQRILSESEFNALRDKVLGSAPDDLSEADFQRMIKPAMAAAIGEAESSPAPLTGSALERFGAGLWRNLNPMGLVNAAMDPKAAVKGLLDAHAAQFDKAKTAYSEGRYTEAAGHLAAAGLPLLGPAAAHAGEQMATGDVAGGLGEGTALVAPIAGRKQIGQATAATGRVLQAVGDSAPVRRIGTFGAAGLAMHGDVTKAAFAAAAPTVLKQGGRVLEGAGELVAGGAEDAAPALNAAQQLKAFLSSGEPIPASRFMELIKQVPPNERAAIIEARQAAVARQAQTASTPSQTPSQPVAPPQPQPQAPPAQAPPQAPPAGPPQGAPAPPPAAAAPPPQAPPQAPPAPTSAAPAAPPVEPPTPPPPTSAAGPQPKSTVVTTPGRFAAAQKVFKDMNVEPLKGEVAAATDMAKWGTKSIEQAVKEVLARRPGGAPPVDPAAQLQALFEARGASAASRVRSKR